MAIGTPTLCAPNFLSGGGTPYNVTTNATVPAGALIIVLASWGRSVDITGTLSGGGLTWQTDQSNVFANGYDYRFGIFSAPAPAGLASGTTLTLTTSGACDGATISICYVTGLDVTSSRKDVSNGAGANTSAWNSGSATTTNADDLIIGGSFMDASTSSTPGSGLTELSDFVNTSNAWTLTTAYKIVSATGSQSVNGTWANSTNEVSAFVAYKAAAAGGTQVSATRALSYSIAAQVSATRAVTYSIAAQVAATRALTYSISKSVAATRALSYSILMQVAATRGLSYAILAPVSASRALNYAILAQVAASRGLSYDILNAATHVSATRALKYDLIAPVSSSRALKYDLIASVAAARALKYDIVKSVAATRALNYNLIASVSTTRRLTYSIGVVTVHGDLMLLWLM